MGWRSFYEHSRRVGGVLRLSSAAQQAGLSVSALRRRARQEGWWWPFPDVAATSGTAIDARARAHAAVLQAQGRTGGESDALAAATGWTAAYLYGVQRSAPSRPQVVVPASRARVRRSRPSPGPEGAQRGGLTPQLLRSRALERGDLGVVQHVPTVTADRLVRDLAASCAHDRLRAAIIDLLHGGHLSLDALLAVPDRWGRFPGRGTVRAIISELTSAGRTDSPFEFLVRDRFASAGIPLDRGQVPVPVRRGGVINCDLGILAIRFAIEADSLGYHSSRAQLSTDAERSNALMTAPETWRVLRITWDMLEGPALSEILELARSMITIQSRRFLGRDWPGPEHLRT